MVCEYAVGKQFHWYWEWIKEKMKAPMFEIVPTVDSSQTHKYANI